MMHTVVMLAHSLKASNCSCASPESNSSAASVTELVGELAQDSKTLLAAEMALWNRTVGEKSGEEKQELYIYYVSCSIHAQMLYTPMCTDINIPCV